MKSRSEQIKNLILTNASIRDKIKRMEATIEANEKRIANLKKTPEYRQERRAAEFRSTVDERLRQCLMMNGKIPRDHED